ncbi:acyl-CoA thioesterase [Sphingosinicella humi]|uniref:Thioesterase n=1 Tax=Allosphingosinicella humi TaxID=2068657 RepID=A0A2U2J5U3_9SPHN|nr:thioesterase family protein [Sphingosinicella humi]PWG03672.1 thioesterase [Sphingosinicella humi]
MTRAPLKGRDHYRTWREIGTRWADNDAYGHVNNTVYYQWFDTAVNGWLIDSGLLDLKQGEPIGLVVETGCRFAAPLAYPQPVDIGLAVERLGNSSVSYRLGVFPKNGSEAAAEGRFVHVYVDREKRRPMRLPERWRSALQRLAD